MNTEYVTGLQEMNTLWHIRSTSAVVSMCGKFDVVLIAIRPSKASLGIYFFRLLSCSILCEVLWMCHVKFCCYLYVILISCDNFKLIFLLSVHFH